MHPRSHCTDCGYAIPVWMNVPILSYILLKGKCGKCGAKIHWHHLAVEIVTPLIYIALFYRYGLDSLLFYKYVVLSSFLIPIFFIDLFHKLVLHVTTIPLIATGLLFSLLPASDVGILNSGITSIVILGLLTLIAYLFFALRKRDGLGGGDIWLLTGIASYFGFVGMPWIVLISCLTAIIYFFAFIRKSDQEFVWGPFIAVAGVFWAVGGTFFLERILVF